MTDLGALFAPRSVAVLGASREPGKLGAVMARQLSAFPGRLSLVNARSPSPAKGVYASLHDVLEATGDVPDLVISCLPAGVTVDALTDAARLGCRAALVCAGGFAEVGDVGQQLQERLHELATATGMRVLGPNTSGFVAPSQGLVASFVPGAERIASGVVGVVAASGGVNHAIAFALSSAGIGLELAVGLGNAVDVAAADVLDHLVTSPTLRCVALHVETVPDGPRLLGAIERASARVPVVALVVGQSDVQDFARSHTGALATSWRTTRSALRQAGAVLVDDERELVDAVGALSALRLPAGSPARVGLVTGQAGPGLLIADGLRAADVLVPDLADATVERLGALLPPLTYQRNPVDTGRPGESFGDVLAAVAADPHVDVSAVYGLLEPDAVDLAACVAELAATSVPVLAVLGGVEDDLRRARATLQGAGVATMTSPAAAVRALRALRDDARSGSRRPDGPPRTAEPDARPSIKVRGDENERELKQLLSRLDVTVPASSECADHAAAHQALAAHGAPVVVKVLEPVLAHKSEAGGVHLNVRTAQDLDRALSELDAMGAISYLVEAMAPAGLEVFVGAHRDPVFGPVAVMGLGGVIAEALSDVAIRTLPLGRGAIDDMVDELTLGRLLRGHRGAPALDLAALGAVIDVVGRIVCDNEHVQSFEINPIRATDEGALVALDASVGVRHDE